MSLLLNGEKHMELASQLAHIAAELDWLKKSGTDEQQAAAQAHIEKLYDIAEQLAGTRVDEIYAPSDGSELEEETHL